MARDAWGRSEGKASSPCGVRTVLLSGHRRVTIRRVWPAGDRRPLEPSYPEWPPGPRYSGQITRWPTWLLSVSRSTGTGWPRAPALGHVTSPPWPEPTHSCQVRSRAPPRSQGKGQTCLDKAPFSPTQMATPRPQVCVGPGCSCRETPPRAPVLVLWAWATPEAAGGTLGPRGVLPAR